MLRFYLDYLSHVTNRSEQIQKLRQIIINLATRGRLVPQDPNDEPACELFKRLQARKAQLIAEGKVKEQKQLRIKTDAYSQLPLPKRGKWCPSVTLLVVFGMERQ